MVYDGFALVAPPVREVGVRTLRVTASDGAGDTGRMTDRIGATLWSTGRPQRGGEWIQVDLGAVVPVALVRWLPGTYQEVPRGLRLEGSLDGLAWRPLVDLPEYGGTPLRVGGPAPPACPKRPGGASRRTDRGPPSPHHADGARRHLGVDDPGAVRVRGDRRRATPAVEADGAELARGLRAEGVRRLYADHGWASRVALADPAIRVPPANLQLDDYGFTGSATMLIPPFHWAAGTGVLLESADAEAFAEAARAGGLAFARRSLAGLSLFVHVPVPPPGPLLSTRALGVAAARRPKRARLAVDGDPATRWATARPRAAGDWFRVDLPAARSVRGVRLSADNPADLPPELVVEGSPDGVRWERLDATGRSEHRYRWGGFGVLDDGAIALRLEFPAVTVKALRLVLPAGDPVFDWSISELAVYGGE